MYEELFPPQWWTLFPHPCLLGKVSLERSTCVVQYFQQNSIIEKTRVKLGYRFCFLFFPWKIPGKILKFFNENVKENWNHSLHSLLSTALHSHHSPLSAALRSLLSTHHSLPLSTLVMHRTYEQKVCFNTSWEGFFFRLSTPSRNQKEKKLIFFICQLKNSNVKRMISCHLSSQVFVKKKTPPKK